MPFTEIENAVAAIARGEIVIVVDDADRENEGDLIMAAEKMTPEAMAFMIRHTSGVICMPVEGERLDELRLPLMVADNTEAQRTAFTVSVDARHGTTTGISAADRCDHRARAARPRRPGPTTSPGPGTSSRCATARAACSSAPATPRPRSTSPASPGCDPPACSPRSSTTTARWRACPQLEEFAAEHGLQLISIADLIRYRRHREKLVRRVSEARIPTRHGDFTALRVRVAARRRRAHRVRARRGRGPGERARAGALRVPHRRRVRLDALRLRPAARRARWSCIAAEGTGVVVYLRGHEGRGIGLGHKIRAYTLQDQGRDTVEANVELGFPADSREYGIGSQILVDLGVTTMRLMTNNPAKYGGLEGYGLEIVERVPLHVLPNAENIRYLRTKQEKLGHLLDIERRRGTSSATQLRVMGTYREYEGALDATGMRIAIVAGRFNDHVTTPLLDGALGTLRDARASTTSPCTGCPGAFELPLVAQAARGVGRVRRGGLPRRGDPGRHAALRLRGGGVRGRDQRVVARHRRAVVFGVLTTDDLDQALARAGGVHEWATRARRRRAPRSRWSPCSGNSPPAPHERLVMLRLVLPKGSLERATLQLFEDADLAVSRGSDVDYRGTIDDPRVDEVRILRPQEIPRYVADGLFDLGITGRDWIEERDADVVTLTELHYSKATARPIRMVLAVAADSPAQTVADLPAGSRGAHRVPGAHAPLLRAARHRRRGRALVRRDRGQGARHRRRGRRDHRDRPRAARRGPAHPRHDPRVVHRAHRQPARPTPTPRSARRWSSCRRCSPARSRRAAGCC